MAGNQRMSVISPEIEGVNVAESCATCAGLSNLGDRVLCEEPEFRSQPANANGDDGCRHEDHGCSKDELSESHWESPRLVLVNQSLDYNMRILGSE